MKHFAGTVQIFSSSEFDAVEIKLVGILRAAGTDAQVNDLISRTHKEISSVQRKLWKTLQKT